MMSSDTILPTSDIFIPIIPSQDVCFICFGKISLRYTLHCRHEFCYMCIKEYYQRHMFDAHVKCPICPKELSSVLYENAMTSEKIDVDKVRWLYSGRNFGWWCYDDITSKQIELCYTTYKNNIDISQSEINPYEKFDIHILGKTYTINFRTMKQIYENTMRDIKRRDTISDEDRDCDIKGISGLRITSTKKMKM